MSTHLRTDRIRNENGLALVLAIMGVALLAALAVSMSVLTSVEMRVAGNFSQAAEARTAAESALESSIHELQGIADWDAVAAGAIRATLVDGAADGIRVLSDGSTVNLAQATASLGETGWQLFAYSPLSALTGSSASSFYLVVWAAPDPGAGPGTMMLRADAFGPGGTRRAVQATVSRTAVLSWSSR